MKIRMKFSIRFLVLFLMTFAMIGTFVGTVVSSVVVSRNNLEQNYLIDNQYYAQKLAITTDSLFESMLKSLTLESMAKEYVTVDSAEIRNDLQHLLKSTSYFNSTLFVDQTGRIVSAAPERQLEGTTVKSVGVTEALTKKMPLISKPYTGLTGKLILLISVPVFDANKNYKGFIAGTIMLQEDNSLKRVLGEHPKHENDSYVFVVDSSGNVIYHPDSRWLNVNVKANEVVQKVMQGKSGSQEVMSPEGIPMLAGYATSASASHWGIVSQTPKESVMQPTFEMAKQVSIIAIPFMITVFFISLFMLNKIVNPIRKLALYAKQITIDPSIQYPRIPNWYFELKDLKRAILVAVNFYQKKIAYAETESNLDPLTGFYNRRFLDRAIKKNLNDYSIILFDIDHFKHVNDRYGHQIGDEVLKFISNLVTEEIRETDLCIRLGGEEFLIVLPHTDIEMAHTVAERIRKRTEMTISPTGKPITISMGIGKDFDKTHDFDELLHISDQALYKAKKEGRNKVVAVQGMYDNKAVEMVK
ncbi:sensor domain-containing diguanylate cyclase [Peribacillus sp. SCS-155]|uniref:sensor domain-containing diguanylate cyclase n=1 Tax=Peribacillus sedimenti TaxID=3115297 RepID=UPI003905B4CE